MKYSIFLILSISALQAQAEGYICKPEKAAAIVQSSDNSHQSGSMKVDTSFFLHYKSDAWIVEDSMTSSIAFNKCDSKGRHCENTNGFSGKFVRLANNQFSVFMMWDTDNEVNDSDVQYIIYAGKCIENKKAETMINKSSKADAVNSTGS